MIGRYEAVARSINDDNNDKFVVEVTATQGKDKVEAFVFFHPSDDDALVSVRAISEILDLLPTMIESAITSLVESTLEGNDSESISVSGGWA